MKTQSPDWQKARSLYDSKMPHAVIVKEAGVTLPALKKRIVREKWRVTRTEAHEIVSQQGIQQKSEQLRGVVLDECLRDANVLQSNEPRNMSQSMRRQELLSKITTNGEKAGTWGNGGNQQPLISITHLSTPAIWIDDTISDGQRVDNGPTPESDAVSTADSRPTSIPCAESYAKNGKLVPQPAVIDVSAQPPQAPAGEKCTQ